MARAANTRMTMVSPGDGIVDLLAARPGEAAKPWAVIMVIDEANRAGASRFHRRITRPSSKERSCSTSAS